MEDALVLSHLLQWEVLLFVLILVLMEDALVLNNFTVTGYVCSLNPCFNGRCTRTESK